MLNKSIKNLRLVITVFFPAAVSLLVCRNNEADKTYLAVLVRAYNDELNDSRQYEILADEYRKKNYPVTADMFDDLSKTERSHAKKYESIIIGMGLNPDDLNSGIDASFDSNVNSLVKKEKSDVAEIYLPLLDTSKERGGQESVIFYQDMMIEEKHNTGRLNKIMERIKIRQNELKMQIEKKY